MGLSLKNLDCQKKIVDCKSELNEIKQLIKTKSPFNKEVAFLTHYSIIRSASCLEVVCKTLISEACENGANEQNKNFFRSNFHEKALNLSYQRLCSTLSMFDKKWNTDFKLRLKSLKSEAQWRSDLDSLIDLRNSFAHGGFSQSSIDDVIKYFNHGYRIIIILERSIV